MRSAARVSPPAQAPVAGPVLEPDAYKILEGYGLPVPRHGFATDAEGARTVACRVGFPVVAKVVSPDILHKSDFGGVITGLDSQEDVEQAFSRLQAIGERHGAELAGVLIVAQADIEHEVMIGGFRDTEFGPVVAVGAGGVLVEVLRDLAYGLAPVDATEALEMIQGTKTGQVLAGFRGRRPADVAGLADAVAAVSRLLADNPWIEEIDLNPVAVSAEGCLVLDARILGAAAEGEGERS